MSRTAIVAILLIVLVAGPGAGTEPAKTIPSGKWRRLIDNGNVVTLAIDAHGAKWVCEMIGTDKGTTTLIAPVCQVAEEGSAFGYIKYASWKKGEDVLNQDGHSPSSSSLGWKAKR